jgi:hypothetical protein
MTRNEPTHIVECETPETWNGETCHPAMSYFYSYDAAERYIRSKLSLGSDIALKHKHIWGIRTYGSNAGDWLYRAAG